MRKKCLLLLFIILLIGCGTESAETSTSPAAPIAIADTGSAVQTAQDDTTGQVNTSSQPPATSNQMSDSNMSDNGSMMDGIKAFVFSDAGNVSFDGIEQNAALSKAAVKAVKRAAQEEEIGRILAIFPVWDAEVSEDGDIWWMDFTSAEGDWLGWAGVNIAEDTVFEFEMAGFKSEEEVNSTLPFIESAAAADPEIQAIIGNTSAGDWYTEAGYDPYDQQYYYYFGSGIESYIATFWIEENGTIYVESISDPDALEEQEQEQWNQDQAIEIAYEIPDIWERFDGIDDYRTFVSPEGDNVYAVSFAHSSGEIVYALVNIATREILDYR